MISSLRFQNWRSLRDVTIDNLGPLTVFIGANASGKSNIFDALHFLRQGEFSKMGEIYDYFAATLLWQRGDIIKTIGSPEGELTKLGVTFSRGNYPPPERVVEIQFGSKYHIVGGASSETSNDFDDNYVSRCILRWQLLAEGFMPPESAPFDKEARLEHIATDAKNTAAILYFLSRFKDTRPVFETLQEDLKWTLEHVESLDVQESDAGLKLHITEHDIGLSPRSSAGTRRVLTMLTAMHMLNYGQKTSLPGLVFIEEPDTAVHPQLHARLVDLFRDYVSDEAQPRQIFLTTHNPNFLNLFKPEEVRLVERDEQGYTRVRHVPDFAQGWLDDHPEYGLGDAWMSRSLGGVPG